MFSTRADLKVCFFEKTQNRNELFFLKSRNGLWIRESPLHSRQVHALPTLQHVTTNNTISYLPSRTFHGQDCGSLDQLLANRSYTSCILSFLGKNPVWVLLKKCILSQLRNCCPLCLIHCLTYCNSQWAGKVHLSYRIRPYSVKMFK